MDREYLGRALELAERGRGRVSPNPLVGAVLVRDGEVIGAGWHVELGGLHAERAALADCAERGEDPAGATIYVSLEPCAHQGRQPPCVEAILAAGIARVVIASDDPSEKTAGRGPELLREAGVAVELASGEEAAVARLLNQPFRKHARTGLPLVTLKLAISLNGETATAPGDSPWISGPESRALVHRWRAEHDAIAVGIGTALADDPLLTARPDERAVPSGRGAASRNSGTSPRQPLRIVFDSQARLPVTSQLVQTLDQAPLLVVTAPGADASRVAALREAGAEVMSAAGDTAADRVAATLRALGEREVTSLFLEGGRTLAATFAAADQIDESRTFVAPVLVGLGGRRAGPVAAGDPPCPAVAKASSDMGPPTAPPARVAALSHVSENVGDDLLVTARYKEW